MGAERPEVNGKVYHLALRRGEVPRYVLLPGDPERTYRIAERWDRWREVARHREFVTLVGEYRGVPIATTSTGIGSGSTAIAIEELLAVGADTFIRVGTTGSLKDWAKVGELVISVGAVRLDGASRHYAPPEYPAVANLQVVNALVCAAESLGVKYHVGITASTDSFYVGQGRPGYKGFLPPWASDILRTMSALNVLNFDMETATIFTLSSIYGARAGSVLAIIANRATGDFSPNVGVDDAVRVANEAVRILHQWDEGGRRCLCC